MNLMQIVIRIAFILLILPSLGYSQYFDDSFIQYSRTIEDQKVLETESKLSWITSNNQDTIEWNKNDITVDEMPRFPGCEEIDDNSVERKKCADNKLLQYIYGNLVYPVEALEERVEGRVIASFYVNPDGSLSNATIKKDNGSYTAGAALDVLDKMNKELRWIPGKTKDETIPVLFTIPIVFKLGPENRIQHPKMYSKYYKTNDDWELIYDPEGEAILNEEAEVRILISENGKVLNTRIYSSLSEKAKTKINEIILDLLENSSWRPGSTYKFENTMEYVFHVKL